MTKITKRYSEIVKVLQPHLPAKAPKLAMTTGHRFWGRIRKTRVDQQFIDIRINVKAFQALELKEWSGQLRENEKGFEAQLTETICHELAHMTYWDHSYKHKNLTQHYMNLLAALTKIEEAPVIQTAAHSVATIQLSDLVPDTKKARAELRKAGIEKPGSRWEWSGQVPAEVKKVLGM